MPCACFTRCPISGNIISIPVFTALVDPGRQNTMQLCATMPATALLSITAKPMSVTLFILNNSPKPGISLAMSGDTASMVTSLGVMPVPPVIMIISESFQLSNAKSYYSMIPIEKFLEV